MDVLERIPATIVSDGILNGNNHFSGKKKYKCPHLSYSLCYTIFSVLPLYVKEW